MFHLAGSTGKEMCQGDPSQRMSEIKQEKGAAVLRREMALTS
jgi:hypothetical protein